jgi:hypothetical protein
MFMSRKPNPPDLFLQFGVNPQGLLVPLLRKVRGNMLQVKRTLKMISVQPRTSLHQQ